jgi:DNA-binding NarL/FixJ family response regulator
MDLDAPTTRATDQIRLVHAVHVVDDVPAYRAGIMSHLRHQGFTVTTDPPPAVAQTDAGDVLVAHTVRGEEDLANVQSLTATGYTVLALVTDPEVRTYAAALLAGATGTVPWDAEPEQIAACLIAVAHGQATVPPSVAASLADRVPQGFPEGWLSARDIDLVRDICEGISVAAIADKLGLGQRSAHRILADLYGKLGATNRTEAILMAQRRGITD